jgi:formylglycine-generating enzyme required for sulfatase activity
LELKRLVDTIPQVKSEVSPALENAFWQKLEKAPAADNISELLREFPQLSSVRLLELKKIAEKNRQFKKTFLPEIKTRIAVLQPKRAPVTTSTPSSTSTAPNQPEPQKPTDTPAPPLPPANALPKPVKPSMVWVQGGTFDMGCTEEQGGNCSSKEEEKPVFDIKVGSYSLGKCEVTFDEYDLFCEHTRREKPDDNGWGRGKRPVVNVSWFEAVDYCNWLSQQHGFAPAYINHILQPRADGYRLPTEAEWEYAARGGSKSQGYQFAGSNNLDEIAWHKANSGNRTHPVGAKKGNELRLEDMSGNVLEWCNDWFSSYTGNGQANPHGPSNGEERVLRSSSWTSYNTQQYVAARRHDVPGNKNDYIGFRLARD